jgi:hypothetical protein
MPVNFPPGGTRPPGSTQPATDPNTPSTTNTGGATGTTGTTPAGNVTGITGVSTDSVSSSGGSSRGSRLDRLKGKVVEKTWDELTKRHTVGTSLDLGDAALGVRLSERIIRGDSAFVTDDPVRAATTERLARDSGESVFWLETGGVMDAGIGLAKSVPVTGVINVHGGFNAKALLEYRALNPHTADARAVASDLVKNHSVRVPVDAEKARALEPGTEVEIIGRGTASLSAGVGAGRRSTTGNISSNVGVSVTGSTGRTGTWSIGVTRLDGDKVRVLLSEVQERTRSVNVGLNAGLTIDGDAVIDDSLGGSIDSATESVGLDSLDDLPGVGDDGIAGLVKKEGAKALEKAVRKYTAFHASKGRSANETRTDMTSYVLDLSTVDGRKAYDELVKLDEGAAKRLSERSPDAISRHVYEEVANTTSTNRRVTFAGAKLLLFNALRKEAEGTLTTGSGTELIRTSRYSRRYSGIITGRRDIKWEGVRVKDAASGASEHFFHMRFAKDDKITHDSEVKDFVRFADYLGAQDADPRDVTPRSNNFFSRLFGSGDDSRVKADIYFTDDGVERIASSGREEVIAAMVDASRALNPDMGDVPLGDPNAVAIMKEFAGLEDQLQELRRSHDPDAQDEERDVRYAQWQCKRRYEAGGYDKKKLKDHAAAWGAGDKLAGRIGEMGTDADSAWTKFFADLGKASKFDYMGSIGALAKLAGSDETLLHEVSFEGGGVHLRAVDEGSLEHPDTAVTNATTGHT